MATQLQIRRGTSTQVAAFTGAEGEIVVNTTNDSVHVNDGSTAGGFEMARADLNNVSDTSLNAALTGNTVSALTITTLTLGSTAITATGTEINLLDGVTATTAELNYVDGVTSAIQTQIDAKAPLASPTFTGTVTAGALTVDTNTLVVDATNNRVGIGTSSPNASADLHVADTSDARIWLEATSGDTMELYAGTNVSLFNRSNNALTFGTNNTERLRITSAGAVGIGISNPTEKLTVVNSSSGIVGRFTNNTNQTLDLGVISGSGSAGGVYYNAANSGHHRFQVGGSTKLKIEGDNVGIGRDPRVMLDVAGEVAIAHNATYGLRFYNQPQNNWSSIGNPDTSSSAVLVFKDASGEAMRLDGSRNLLVGKTALEYSSNAGVILRNDGLISSVRSGGNVCNFNRLSSDGEIIQLNKDGTNVGSIATWDGEIAIGRQNCALLFDDDTNRIKPHSVASNTVRDNALDLGGPSARFDDIYATNGTIQTSDRNEKQDIEALSEAEQRVAVAAKGLLRKFRWKDSVAEKGDDARIHFGIIAQDLQDAFTTEGLDAGRYAMFISSTWTDEDGNEQTRLGVRYSELLAFIISAI